MAQLITYHGRLDLKAAFLGEIAKHEALDALTKGTYGQMNGHFTGCAIGCSVYSLNVLQGKTPQDAARRTGDHARITQDLGWPLWLAHVEDHIFEHLSDHLSKTWPRRLAETIPVGVTVPNRVLAQLLRWQLLDQRFGVVHATDDVEVKAVVQRMGALFDRTLAGEDVAAAEWNEAAWDARDAWAARAARAAWDARDAWDAWAARAAWDAWDARDAWDAWAARAAWDAWDAETRDGFYPALADELLRLLRELGPHETQVA